MGPLRDARLLYCPSDSNKYEEQLTTPYWHKIGGSLTHRVSYSYRGVQARPSGKRFNCNFLGADKITDPLRAMVADRFETNFMGSAHNFYDYCVGISDGSVRVVHDDPAGTINDWGNRYLRGQVWNELDRKLGLGLVE